ncbi:MAG: hypothetical protein AAGI07_13160 [Bacteroidota bacterium]
MSEVSNLDKLTEQIYQEGIERADAEAARILAETKEEKERIILNAKQAASNILQEAERKAEGIKRNTEADIRLSGEQMISDIKNKIHTLIAKELTKPISKELFQDADFLKSLIIELVKKWDTSSEIELYLAATLEKEGQNRLKNSVLKALPNLTIYTDSELSGGFKVAEKKGKWQMTFTDKGFAELFNQYIRDTTANFLFLK